MIVSEASEGRDRVGRSVRELSGVIAIFSILIVFESHWCVHLLKVSDCTLKMCVFYEL